MLCCVILGGLGSLRGTLLGVFLLIGFDNIVSPVIDSVDSRLAAERSRTPANQRCRNLPIACCRSATGG